MTAQPVRKATDSITRLPWQLWFRQVRAIVALESKRNLFSWRSLWVYFLAFAPTVIILLHAAFDGHESVAAIEEDTLVLAGIFQFYYLRLGIFFGCLGIFMKLIRGEMVERSLHYYLLAPVQREVLLIGKFLAGAVRSILLFESAVVLSFVFMYVHFGSAGERFVFDGPGMSHLVAYLGITVLACLGYGSIFLLFSMLMKNPFPAALLFMGWEVISVVMPQMLQRLSVISYLKHLLPVAVPARGLPALLTVNIEPVPAWIAATGALLLTAGVLAVCCLRVRALEISYTTE